MCRGDAVVATQIAQRSRMRISHIRGRQHRQASIEQRLSLLQVVGAVTAYEAQRHTGKVIAGARCREVEAVEVIYIYALIGEVAIAQGLMHRVLHLLAHKEWVEVVDTHITHIRATRICRHNWHKGVAVAVETCIVDNAIVLHQVRLREGYRTLPLEVSKQVEHKQMVLRQHALVYFDIDLVGEIVALRLIDDA